MGCSSNEDHQGGIKVGGYIGLDEYPKYMGIQEDDIVFISSDTKTMLWDARENNAHMDLGIFIDALKDAVGDLGTVIFPTYNWDFCDGKTFDYENTPCKTGILGRLALGRPDFRRTRHPIYSFAVWGKYQDLLCGLENKDSFGCDSPFAFFRDHDVKNYVIDVPLEHSFTYAHFVEQQSGVVGYRYVKDFRADYIDEKGSRETRTYSMFVRDLDKDVHTTIDPIQEDLIRYGAAKKIFINNSKISLIYLGRAYDMILDDIKKNRSRKICTYLGQ